MAAYYNGERHDTIPQTVEKVVTSQQVNGNWSICEHPRSLSERRVFVLSREPHKSPNLPEPTPMPIPSHDQTLDQTLRQLTDRYGSFDQQVAPLDKRVTLLSNNEKPVYVRVAPIGAEYRLLLEANNQEEVALWSSTDFPPKIQFSIRGVPIDVPYELSVVIHNHNVTYTVNVNTEYAKNALQTVFAQALPSTR